MQRLPGKFAHTEGKMGQWDRRIVFFELHKLKYFAVTDLFILEDFVESIDGSAGYAGRFEFAHGFLP